MPRPRVDMRKIREVLRMSGMGWPGWLIIRTARIVSPVSWTRRLRR